MRKTRHECPAFARLKMHFDIHKLYADFNHLNKIRSFGSLSKEYHNLCDLHNKLPSYFLKEGEEPDEKAGYSQLAISEWDDKFSLNQNPSAEESFWSFRTSKEK